MKTSTTLVSGGDAGAREAAIALALGRDTAEVAMILEGMPAATPAAAADINSAARLVRIAPGCPCCSGNMVMRVTLNRILRQKPTRLFISLANDSHVAQFKAFLTRPPYDAWLILTSELRVDAAKR